jgi:hypothetical protein
MLQRKSRRFLPPSSEKSTRLNEFDDVALADLHRRLVTLSAFRRAVLPRGIVAKL